VVEYGGPPAESGGTAPCALIDRCNSACDRAHALHDVVSDILASPILPRQGKRAALLAAAAAYRDSTTGDEVIDSPERVQGVALV
jgi:hypothetical protein